MITQVKWFRIYDDNMIYINKELAKLQPPNIKLSILNLPTMLNTLDKMKCW